MATPTGGQYVFATADGTPVDLFLTPGAGASDPGAGGNAFDLEIFTVTNPGTSDPGFEGSAFAEGGTQNGDTVLAASLQLNDGDYMVIDSGGSDSIIAGSGNQTIIGGVQTTIIGGTGTLNVDAGNENLVILGDAAAATVNALGGSGEQVVLGTNSAIVYASANDTVDAGAGTGIILFGNETTITAQMTVTGASGKTFTVASAGFGQLIGSAATATITALGKDTISTDGVTATVNALDSDAQTVNLGKAAATVYAGAGDTVNAGAGTGVIAFGDKLGIVDQVALSGASANTFTVASGTHGTLIGSAASATITALGQDTISTGAVSAVVNALDGDVQTINFGAAGATVYAGVEDTINAGDGQGVIVYGDAASGAPMLTVSGSSANSFTVATAAFGTLIQAAASATITSLGKDTISTGSVAAIVNTFDPDAQTVNLGGAGSGATVYAGTGDTVNAGAGTGVIIFGDALVADAQVSVTGASANAYTITALDGDVLIGTGGSITVTSLAAETVAPGAVTATINALDASAQFMLLGKAASTVYAGAGDTIDAGKGQSLVILDGGQAMTLSGAAATNNISIISAAGTVVGSATKATIVGVAGDTIVATDNNQTVNALAGNELISISGGTDTVFGGAGDTIGVGGNEGTVTVAGSELWVHGTGEGGSIGFGTFETVGSTTTVTVGNAVGENFDTTAGGDFIFYPNETDAVSALIIAAAVDAGGNVTFLLPDGTSMTLIGVSAAQLDPVNMFRPAPT